MNAQDSSSLHRSNTPLLNNFNRSDLNDNKKDYHMVKPDSEDASKAVSIFYSCCTLKLRSSFQKIAQLNVRQSEKRDLTEHWVYYII